MDKKLTSSINRDFAFNMRAPVECNAEFVHFVANSFMLSASMFTASECGLFDLIESGTTCLEELSQATDLPAEQLQKLLSFCAGLGLIKRSGDDWLNNRIASELLVSSSDSSIKPIISHYQDHVYGTFGSLLPALRSGTNQVYTWNDAQPADDDTEFYAELSKDNEEYMKFLRAMNMFSKGVGHAIADTGLIPYGASLVDMGCGGGQVSAEIAQRIPGIRFTLIDKEPALRVAEELMTGLVVEPPKFIVDDILSPTTLGSGFADVVLVSAVLGDWGPNEQAQILANAHRMLKQGGRVLVSETLLNDDLSGPLLPAIMSLYVLLLTKNGKNLSNSEIVNTLVKAGFSDCQVFDMKAQGLRDLAVASKLGDGDKNGSH
jgi:2-polyprenyl-3-methyl-5-hydroxy-6-metoxy-1,4-benzoquinol methylase